MHARSRALHPAHLAACRSQLAALVHPLALVVAIHCSHTRMGPQRQGLAVAAASAVVVHASGKASLRPQRLPGRNSRLWQATAAVPSRGGSCAAHRADPLCMLCVPAWVCQHGRQRAQRGMPALTRGAGDVASPAEPLGVLAQLLCMRHEHWVNAIVGIGGHCGQHMRGMAQALQRLAAARRSGRGRRRGRPDSRHEQRKGRLRRLLHRGLHAAPRAASACCQRTAGPNFAPLLAGAGALQWHALVPRPAGRAPQAGAHLRVSHSAGSKWKVRMPRCASRSHFSRVRHVPATSHPRCWKKRAAPAGRRAEPAANDPHAPPRAPAQLAHAHRSGSWHPPGRLRAAFCSLLGDVPAPPEHGLRITHPSPCTPGRR